MSGLVVRTDTDGVTELRLNRPEQRNAVSTQLLRELRDHLARIQDDASTRVVIVTGAGAAFSAGADVKEFPAGATSHQGLTRIRLVAEVLRRLMDLEMPTIAAVHGAAVGAGWGLALACDLCFASRQATFALPEIAKGYRLPPPLTDRLVQVVGPVAAAEIMLGGATYSVEDAAARGWVTRVFTTTEELTGEAWRFGRALASRSRSSVATAIQSLRRAQPAGPIPPPEFMWTEESQ